MCVACGVCVLCGLCVGRVCERVRVRESVCVVARIWPRSAVHGSGIDGALHTLTHAYAHLHKHAPPPYTRTHTHTHTRTRPQLFLSRALMPLHKPKCVGMYQQQLGYCVTQVRVAVCCVLCVLSVCVRALCMRALCVCVRARVCAGVCVRVGVCAVRLRVCAPRCRLRGPRRTCTHI